MSPPNPLLPPSHAHSIHAVITVSFNASTIQVQEDDGEVQLTLVSSVAVHQPFTVTLQAGSSPSDERVATGEASAQYCTVSVEWIQYILLGWGMCIIFIKYLHICF